MIPVSDTFNKDFVYNVKKAKGAIHLDGVVDETDWHEAQKATPFFLVLPIDTGYPQQQSEVMLTYDNKALYMAFIFYDTIPGKRIMESFGGTLFLEITIISFLFSILFLIRLTAFHLEYLLQEPNGTEQ
jgi:hypothetical protein